MDGREFEFGEVTLSIGQDGPMVLAGSLTVREPGAEPEEVRLHFEFPLRSLPSNTHQTRELFALWAMQRLLRH